MSVDSPTIYEARQTPTSHLGQEIPPAAAPKPPAGRLVGDKTLYMPTIYPQQEAPPAAACKPVRPLDRLGPLSAIHLTVGPLLLFGPLAWLAFIWFAGEDVELRHSVLVGDWVTKSITICTLVLRTESGLLSGLCTGMLAALALEQAGGVRLVDAATYSIVGAARSDSMLPRLLSAFSSSMARSAFAVLITGLAFALLVTTTAIQFSSLILVSDLAVTQIPGVASSSNTSYRFNCSQDQIFDLPYRRIEGRVGSWYRKPAFYPTFAEYSEPPFIQDGVSDTGVTLRAMVPSSAAPTRETVQRFEGSTTVLDTRVTCQRPVLNNVYVQAYNSSNYLYTKGTLHISGQIWSSIATPRLYNRTYQGNILSKPQIDIPDNGVWFNCSSSNNASESGPLLSYQWRTSLCQLGSSSGPGPLTYAGGLLPEFYNGTTSNMLSSGPGTAYLVLNITSGLTDDWLQVPGIYTGVAPHSIQEKAEWADLLFAYGRVTLSTTLCYTAFSASNLQQSVTMTGAADRSEPLPGYNYGQSVYTFNDIRRQLGQDRQSYSSKDRGILLLERKDSWVDNSTLYGGANYIEMFADGINTTPIPTTSGFAANYTLILYDWGTSGTDDTSVSVPDKSYIHLFQEIVTTGGSISFAIQSLLTVLGTTTYYDQSPQFDVFNRTEWTYFVAANAPNSSRGFAIISSVTVFHWVLVLIITVLFATRSELTSFRTSWQTIAHMATAETYGILPLASHPATIPGDIERALGTSSRAKTNVRLRKLNREYTADGLRQGAFGLSRVESKEQAAIPE